MNADVDIRIKVEVADEKHQLTSSLFLQINMIYHEI